MKKIISLLSALFLSIQIMVGQNDSTTLKFDISLRYRFEQWHGMNAKNFGETVLKGGKKSDPVIHTFDPAFGAQDKFYGWMNIVSWSNLHDPEIVMELYPSGKKMWGV